MKRRQIFRGFTLIELLIVVSIIAILAAIGVVQFLNAMVRSRISRAKADMIVMAHGIEAYQMEYNFYPPPCPAHDFHAVADHPFNGHLPARITTPIGHVNQLLKDPFKLPGDMQFHYVEARHDMRRGDGTIISTLYETTFGRRNTAIEYIIISQGPDGRMNRYPWFPNEDPPAMYDPTNGSHSSGDIYFFGPGLGFSGVAE